LYMVRYDTRGHGLSGKPQTPDFYTSDRYADDLKAIITGFGLKNPFFAGWSFGGAIAADIASNFPHPLPFSGLIYLAALSYIGDILPKVSSPLVSAFLPGMEDAANTTRGLSTRIDFVETFSAKNDQVPFSVKVAWAGSTAYLPPLIASLVAARTQDPSRLFEEAKAGWPLLILHGTADRLINGTAVIENMKPLFKDIESHLLDAAGHIVFYDDEPGVAGYILSFIERVLATDSYH